MPRSYAMTALATEVEANATEVELDPLLVELVKIRTSQINGCGFCLDVHTCAALSGGVTLERLAVLPAWRETQFFSEQERAALALAEAVTLVADGHAPDDIYASVAKTLPDAQLSAESWLAIVMNAWNRIAITSRHPVGPTPHGRSTRLSSPAPLGPLRTGQATAGRWGPLLPASAGPSLVRLVLFDIPNWQLGPPTREGTRRDYPREPPECAVTDTLVTHAALRQRVLDDHMFSVDLGLAKPSTFRLQLFTTPNARPVAIATQTPTEGMSLTNGAERYAVAVWHQYFSDDKEPPLWIQRELGHSREIFQLVSFTVGGRHGLASPQWRFVPGEALAQLVGVAVDPDRGEEYAPQEPEPVGTLHYAVAWVARLPRPDPVREPHCMPVGVPWWRRLVRQVLPSRRTEYCCWYQSGDWHKVSETAIRLVRQSQRNAVPTDGIASHVLAQAETEGLTGWELDALDTIVSPADGIQIEPDGDGHRFYINGQHRAQALLDAGVHRTIVISWQISADGGAP
ncbi:MAG: carboxymuconolactone decarboxylase family protein [Pseudonocardiaceae bacterium]